MYIQKAGTTSKNLTAQRLLVKLGLELFLASLIIVNAPEFRSATRRRKSSTKFVHATPACVGTTTVSAPTRLNALRSSLAFYNGSLLRKPTMNLPVCPKKSPAPVRQSARLVTLIRRLEKDAALASRRLEKLGKKSSGEQGRTQDYTDALKLAKIIALRYGSNGQQ